MDAFEDLYQKIWKMSMEKAKTGESKVANAYFIDKKGEFYAATIIVNDRREFRNVVRGLITRHQAEAYVFVTEMWMSITIEKPKVQPKDDPNSIDVIVVLGYHKDGRKKIDGFAVTKNRCVIEDHLKPPIDNSIAEFVIGNVFQLRHCGISG